jgi:hypothetical protein
MGSNLERAAEIIMKISLKELFGNISHAAHAHYKKKFDTKIPMNNKRIS